MAHNLDRHLDRYSPIVLSVFRVVFGLLFAGLGSIGLFDWPIQATPPIPVGAWPNWYASLIEFILGLFLAAGLFTRAAAFIASGQMAVAYFWIHLPHGFWPFGNPPAGNGGMDAVLFCFAFFLLVFIGGGSFSVDARRGSA
jgi:putative oxidoreductase